MLKVEFKATHFVSLENEGRHFAKRSIYFPRSEISRYSLGCAHISYSSDLFILISLNSKISNKTGPNIQL